MGAARACAVLGACLCAIAAASVEDVGAAGHAPHAAHHPDPPKRAPSDQRGGRPQAVNEMAIANPRLAQKHWHPLEVVRAAVSSQDPDLDGEVPQAPSPDGKTVPPHSIGDRLGKVADLVQKGSDIVREQVQGIHRIWHGDPKLTYPKYNVRASFPFNMLSATPRTKSMGHDCVRGQ